MPKKAKKTKQNHNQNQQMAEPSQSNAQAAAALYEQPTQSPYKFMALFFGIPAAILAAAIIVRLMG